MTRAEPRREPCPDRLEILTFCLGGVRMAADVEQVLEMLDPDPARAAGPTSAPRTDASLNDGPALGFQTPKVLVLRGQGKMRVVAIDRPCDILTVPVGSIQPMPDLVAACIGARPYWGTVILDGSPVLLVNLEEFLPLTSVQPDCPEVGEPADPRRFV